MRARVVTRFLALLLPLILGGALALPVRAGDDPAEQEMRAIKERIGQMMKEAHELEGHGQADEARAVRSRAEELERHLQAILAQRAREAKARAKRKVEAEPDAQRRRKSILRGLAQGLEALKALGGQEELVARLQHLHARLQAHPGALPARDREDGDRPAREDPLAGPERLAHRVEILEIALHGLREAERGDAAEILERAIRSGRMALAERQDEEARAFLAQTPPLAQLARILHMASELWMEFGHERKARTVEGLARHYAQRAQAESRAPEHEEREPAQGGRMGGAERARAEELERLHREMQEIHRALEAMQRRLLDLTR